MLKVVFKSFSNVELAAEGTAAIIAGSFLFLAVLILLGTLAICGALPFV